MSIFLDKKRWHEVFAGWDIIDVVVQDKSTLHLCAKKRLASEEASHLFDYDIPTRLVILYTERPVGENCGYQELNGMGYPVVGVSRAKFSKPVGLLAALDEDGQVWPRGGGTNGPMEHIAPGDWPSTKRLKCIGDYTYSVGVGRAVYKRIGVGEWVPLHEGFPDVDASTDHGFEDIDAFSDSDMYAIGGNGDVWHFNGTRWQQMGFPSNVQLGTVTCAGDGNVYISGEGGSLWVGGKSTWKPLYQGGSGVLWNDALWFQNKLWLASDYQFCQLNGKDLDTVTHEGEMVYMNGHMDVHDGILVIAGAENVRSFDGTTWRSLIAPYFD